MRFEFSGKRWERRVAQNASKIISGGQSGADRAGLDFAIETSLEYVGFVPMGRKAEDNADSLRLEVQALTDFLCSNKIEVLNVAGPRESKKPGVYEWTLTMLRLFLNRTGFWSGDPQKTFRGVDTAAG